MVSQERKGVAFGSFIVHNLEEVRFGFGDMHLWSEQFTQFNSNLIQVVRLIDNKQLRCLLFDDFDEIRFDIILGAV
ncbi:hypothetical protein D3C74_423390 [compost metagenome]